MLSKGDSLTKRITVITMGVLILIPGSIGFGTKLFEFFNVLTHDADGSFAVVPIASYICVSLGFVFFLTWGLMKGMFTDIEGPKYRMLEREAELEKMEGRLL